MALSVFSVRLLPVRQRQQWRNSSVWRQRSVPVPQSRGWTAVWPLWRRLLEPRQRKWYRTAFLTRMNTVFAQVRLFLCLGRWLAAEDILYSGCLCVRMMWSYILKVCDLLESFTKSTTKVQLESDELIRFKIKRSKINVMMWSNNGQKSLVHKYTFLAKVYGSTVRRRRPASSKLKTCFICSRKYQ